MPAAQCAVMLKGSRHNNYIGHSMPLPSVNANIRLLGAVDFLMVSYFQQQLDYAYHGNGSVVIELTTCGGGAESARRMAADVALFRKHSANELFFLGKATVYSAGTTFMAEFPNTHRYMAEGTLLMVHERRMVKQLALDGPTSSNIQIVREVLSELETGRKLEMEAFEKLAAGSRISAAEIAEKARTEWYITAGEALELGLIAGIV